MKLSDALPQSLILLDCETTGGKAGRDRITEIALIEIANGEEISRWQTLINPGISIPPWITRITGIDNQMVANAPRFEDIAEELWQRLQGKVLMAHHARFDSSFLKLSFKQIGIRYSPQVLCSVKLSRSLFPEHRSHSLDAIIKRLSLKVAERHRAMDDTEVILALLKHISTQCAPEAVRSACQQQLRRPSLPSQLDANTIDDLPEAPGVYRFYDAEGQLLYVGKSINIRQRVLSHFTDITDRKGMDLYRQLSHIEFDETPSDFGAQLLENQQIKQLTPRYNRRQTKNKYLWTITLHENAQGYHQLALKQLDLQQALGDSSHGLFRSQKQAEQKIESLLIEHQLCQRLTGLDKRKQGACFNHQLKRCLGACCGAEIPLKYNLRVNQALHSLKNPLWPWPGPVIVEEYATEDAEQSHYHLIDNWLYLGRVRDQQEAWQKLQAGSKAFDVDAYKIQLRFLLGKASASIKITPLTGMSDD
ncbi:exonuclease domain-containing protein [Methylophaga lonarensis]